MKRLTVLSAAICLCVIAQAGLSGLQHRLERIVGNNRVGIAVISCNGDTVGVHATESFDLASVMKFHQAAAIARLMDYDSIMNSTVRVDPKTLRRDTWSPMRASAPDKPFDISAVALLDYSLMMSDNNAADLLFEHYASPAKVDSTLRAANLARYFNIAYTEADMHADSLLSNRSTALDAARCIYRFFTADTAASATLVKAIMARESEFGKNRIVAGVKPGTAKVFHKTGTGFNGPSGTPSAINDLAFVSYPRPGGYGCYALAVFVDSFEGPAAEAEAMIAEISEAVWNAVIVDEFVAMNAGSKAPAASKVRDAGKDPEKYTFVDALFDIGASIIYEAIDSKINGD